MSENFTGPLSLALFRTLTDKLYEKRKAGALEIEKMVREQITNNQVTQMEAVLNFLGDLARSQNSNSRKGGLIGLAAVAIATGKMAVSYTNQLILPVLESFNDPDSRIRYYACEALYNIIKITREATLVHFKTLFDTLARLVCDVDQNVRNGADLLDRSLKDIVTASTTFRIGEFVTELRERIYVKNSTTRRFLVCWVQALHNVPQINLVPFLPEILDGFFHVLSDDTPRTRETCEAVLGEFLKSIEQKPQAADLEHMVNILIVHAQSQDDLVRLIALIWLREFLLLDGNNMVKSASGYLTAVLPCLSFTDDQKKSLRDTANSINENLMKFICDEKESPEICIDLHSIALVLQENLRHSSVQTRVAVLHWIHHLYKRMPTKALPFMEDLFPILLQLLPDTSDEVVLLDLEVLSDVCNSKNNLSSMNTEKLLTIDLPDKILKSVEHLSSYYIKLIMSLLDIFRYDVKLLMERGSFIIRQLCVLLEPDQIFRTLSVFLTHENDLQFAAQMIQILNCILLTSTELFPLRNQLKDFNNDKTVDLFIHLYECWSHQPIALLALCLLTRNYKHASALIQIFLFFEFWYQQSILSRIHGRDPKDGDRESSILSLSKRLQLHPFMGSSGRHFSDLEVTVEFLTEIDKLIQLLESPIFTYLRLQLLDPEHQPHIAAVFYGLLMLLPQTEAFHTLQRRLACLPQAVVPTVAHQNMPYQNGAGDSEDRRAKLNFAALLKHFRSTQERHKISRHQKHKDLLINATK